MKTGRLASESLTIVAVGFSAIVNVVARRLPVDIRAYDWLGASMFYPIKHPMLFILEGLTLLNIRRFSYFATENHPPTVCCNETQVGVMMAVRF